MLDAYEADATNSAYLKLVELFNASKLPHILGLKFQYYMRDEVDERTPDTLYRIARAAFSASLLFCFLSSAAAFCSPLAC